ncbi:MAG: hypothetical protein JWM82_1920, partial [Myxococcales bacterium]|nr:hypothetical protein [Myxococcales bacterium]
GLAIMAPLKKYLANAESISWPLKLLDKVADRALELQVLQEILARHEPGYERDPTKKIQLLNHLAGLKDGSVPALVAPYLVDMDEGVRYAAAEALVRLTDEAVAVAPLLARFTDPQEDSLRVRLLIAEGFADLGWRVPADARAGVEKYLPDSFKLTKNETAGLQQLRIVKKLPAKD